MTPHPARSLSLPGQARPALAVLILGALLTGCSPAPSAQFVVQAERLHRDGIRPALVTDKDLDDYVQEIGQRIMSAARDVAPDKTGNEFFSDVQFQLVGSKVPNVVPTGGRHIYVFAGLFQFCQTEEELAAAMCHAYAHLANLDVEKTGWKPDANRSIRADVWQYATHPFTPAQEVEADRLGYAIFVAAGWDPSKFEYLFQRLRDKYPTAADPARPSLVTRSAVAHDLQRGSSTSQRRPTVADRKTFVALRRQAIALAGSHPTTDADTYLLAMPNCLLSAELPEQIAAQNALRPPPPSAARLEPN